MRDPCGADSDGNSDGATTTGVIEDGATAATAAGVSEPRVVVDFPAGAMPTRQQRRQRLRFEWLFLVLLAVGAWLALRKRGG